MPPIASPIVPGSVAIPIAPVVDMITAPIAMFAPRRPWTEACQQRDERHRVEPGGCCVVPAITPAMLSAVAVPNATADIGSGCVQRQSIETATPITRSIRALATRGRSARLLRGRPRRRSPRPVHPARWAEVGDRRLRRGRCALRVHDASSVEIPELHRDQPERTTVARLDGRRRTGRCHRCPDRRSHRGSSHSSVSPVHRHVRVAEPPSE